MYYCDHLLTSSQKSALHRKILQGNFVLGNVFKKSFVEKITGVIVGKERKEWLINFLIFFRSKEIFISLTKWKTKYQINFIRNDWFEQKKCL